MSKCRRADDRECSRLNLHLMARRRRLMVVVAASEE